MFDQHDPDIVARGGRQKGGFGQTAIIAARDQRRHAAFAPGRRVIHDPVHMGFDEEGQEMDPAPGDARIG